MKKQDLLKLMDDTLLEKLFAFCYARSGDSYEAKELSSDIIFALIKAANSEGEIENPYPFIWRVARNVYADFSDKRRRHAELFYKGDAEEVLCRITDEAAEDNSDELLKTVYRQISFLTKAYREVMILFYIDGLSTSEIARLQATSEGAIRQRLFSARQKIRSEVEKMSETGNKPVVFDKMKYVIWGSGNPSWSDPRNVCTRQFSKQIVWLCRNKPMSAVEIAEELNVPTMYVDEELEILASGEFGKYGLLRKLDNGKYIINFILLDSETLDRAIALYTQMLPKVCDTVSAYIEKHREEYLAFPYLNRKKDLNLILWQQVFVMSRAFSDNVEKVLEEKYFSDVAEIDRPFSVFGYVDNGKYYGGGLDGVFAENVCGYSDIWLSNIYITRIRPHFHCDMNVATDPQIQWALRAIEGVNVDDLTEVQKEQTAKAIECGYLYREGGMLYTKILVNDKKDSNRLFEVSERLRGFFETEAEKLAAELADMIRRTVPKHLLAEWRFFNVLANMPVLDGLVEELIKKGLLVPPEDGIGAEGCWMSVAR